MKYHGVGLLVLFVLGVGLRAQTLGTEPVGYLMVGIAAGGISSRTLSVLSFPLQESASVVGQVRGRITSLTANSITNSNAGWMAGALSLQAEPHLVRITSGSAAGRTFLISSASPNTSTTVVIDPVDAAVANPATLGIAAGNNGDSYCVLRADTLSSVFGTPAATGILGGTSSGTADIIQVLQGGEWRQYYFCTRGAGNWRRVGSDALAENVVIRPDSGVIYSRLAPTALTLLVAGAVPLACRQAAVARSGASFISNAWPVDGTLAGMKVASLPGWVSGTKPIDYVQLLVSGAWRQYYFNGVNWRRVGPNTLSDNVPIPAGSAMVLQRQGASAGYETLFQEPPYSF